MYEVFYLAQSTLMLIAIGSLFSVLFKLALLLKKHSSDTSLWSIIISVSGLCI